MARPIVLSNGDMLVGLDQYGMVHDLYYPYVGQDNHASARHMHHRIGIWVDGRFSWLDDGSWDIGLKYQEGSLVGNLTAKNDQLKILLTSRDFIDCNETIFARELMVTNLSHHTKQVRLFFHQVFQIRDANIGDTAQYRPNQKTIVHYSGRRAFAVGAVGPRGKIFDQYSVGLYGIEGREGTYRDAEDGELAGNSVEYGTVDSVLRVTFSLDPNAEATTHYWLAAADHPDAAIALHEQFRNDNFKRRREVVEQSWKSWLHPTQVLLNAMPDKYRHMAASSLMIMKSHIDNRGGVLASADSEILNNWRDYYGYCWPRDAANILKPLVKLGYTEEARHFFDFCGRVRHRDGYLMHKYQMDGALGSSWHSYLQDGKPALPIQEDETAAVVLLAEQYMRQINDPEGYGRELFGTIVRPAANFMASYIDEKTALPLPSYDLWEQKFATHSFTVSIVHGALVAASHMAETYGSRAEVKQWAKVAARMRKAAHKLLWNEAGNYFYKSLYTHGNQTVPDPTVDISAVYGAMRYGLLDSTDPKITRALTVAEQQLTVTTPIGPGIARFEQDNYYQADHATAGNPWLITTIWLARLKIMAGHQDKADEIIDWVMRAMSSTGTLPEQISPKTGDHVSVEPLIWAQAEFINLLNERYGKN